MSTVAVSGSVGVAGCSGGGGGGGENNGESAEPQEPSSELQAAGGACTDDNIIKIVDAELNDGIQKTLDLAIENVGNQAVCDLNIQVNPGNSGPTPDGCLQAGTRTTFERIEFSERPEDLSDVSVRIAGNMGSEFGEVIEGEPCIE